MSDGRCFCECANAMVKYASCNGCRDDDQRDWECPTCRGSGTVNALTNPPSAPFVASYGTCPTCDGTGEMP